jgi:serine/threonine-protein kinase
VIGRYALFGEIASGGMATVHLGRLVGAEGFSRTVAIKRLHPQFANDPEFVSMFLDEARLASRIHHPNVVTTLDVVSMPNEVFLVMEYVSGESLSRLIKNARTRGTRIPPGHAAAAVSGLLHGLHAAHEAKSERREPLNIVHRDVSPQNLLVGVDGVSRVLDFGVAKAAMRSTSTRDGQMKGKLSYMSPEQLGGKSVDRRTDIFAAGVVLWEALVGKRLFDGADPGELFGKVMGMPIPSPKTLVEIPDALDAVVMRSLERDPEKRYQTARAFAIDLERAIAVSTPLSVGEWVEDLAKEELARRSEVLAEIERVSMIPAAPDLEEVDGIEEVVEPASTTKMKTGSGSMPRLPGFEATTKTPSSRSGSGASAFSGETSSGISRPSTVSGISQPSSPGSGISQPSSPGSGISKRSASGVTSPSLSTSAVSNLAIPAAAAPAAAPARPAWQLWTFAALAAIFGSALAYLLFSRGPTSVSPASPAPSAAVRTPEPVPAPLTAAPAATPSPVEKHAEPTETVRVEDLPPAPSNDEPPPSKVHAARAPSSKHAAPKESKAASTKAAAVNCNPPFTVDANGIKRVKPGCL